jgi:type IV secretory pathway TrbL component
MKKFLLLIPIVALMTACGTSDPYAKRAEQEREYKNKLAERAIDKAPKWMTEIPTSSSAVFEAGTAVSSDFAFADDKAKAIAYGRICMLAGGTASQFTNVYRTDSEATSTEFSEMAIRTKCKSVDLTGAEVKEIKRITEGGRFRTYVLVALPTGDANILRKAKDAARQREIAAARAPQAFKELDNQ